MKKFISAALFAAVVTLVITTCTWFASGKKGASSNPLMGKWSFDSLSYGKDSNNFPLEFVLYALAFFDSSKTILQFTQDSVLYWLIAKKRTGLHIHSIKFLKLFFRIQRINVFNIQESATRLFPYQSRIQLPCFLRKQTNLFYCRIQKIYVISNCMHLPNLKK